MLDTGRNPSSAKQVSTILQHCAIRNWYEMVPMVGVGLSFGVELDRPFQNLSSSEFLAFVHLLFNSFSGVGSSCARLEGEDGYSVNPLQLTLSTRLALLTCGFRYLHVVV